MKRERSAKVTALLLLAISIVTLSIAYAMLSNKLSITENAKIDPINWNIYFDNIDNINKEGKARIVSNPVIDTSDKRKIKDIEVILNEPGDKVSFTVDLVNESDITAIISEIVKSTISYEFVEFKAMYTGTNIEVEEGNIIASKTAAGEERKSIIISIYYSKEKVTNDDLHNIPSEGLKINFSYGLTFAQSDELANMPNTTKWINGCTTDYVKKASSETYQVGELISFCNKNASYTNSDGVLVKGKSEDFYVIKDNGDTVSALASHNLMVGSTATDDYAKLFTGLQAMPQQNETYKYYEIAFADKDENNKTGSTYLGYWANAASYELSKPIEAYGESYPTDVYDKNSLLYEHLENYKKYFSNTLGKTAEIRLIAYDELIGLGCDASKSTCKTDTITANKREWVYSTYYWSTSARSSNRISCVHQSGYFNSEYFWSINYLGLRPVITISKSNI